MIIKVKKYVAKVAKFVEHDDGSRFPGMLS